MVQRTPVSVVEDRAHEGPNDPLEDRQVLAEALTERERYRTNPHELLDREAFKSELRAAEASGELPD